MKNKSIAVPLFWLTMGSLLAFKVILNTDRMKNYVIYFIIVFGVMSCTTERKAIKYLDKHPLVAANYCSSKYPVVPTYIKGKDSIIEKTVTIKGDSVPCPPNEKGEVIKVKCPDAKVFYQERWRTDTITLDPV